MPSDNELDTESRASAETTSLRPEDSAEAISALDNFASEITGKKPDVPAAPKPAEPPAPTPKADEPAAPPVPTPKADEPPAPTPKADEPSAPVPTTDDPPAPATDPLDAIELPPHTKPKTAESFGKLREAAKGLVAAATEKANAAQAQVVQLQQQIDELKKTSGQIPEALQKELEELRKNRSVQDIDSDPEIKKFDASIAANTEVIYKRLRAAGYSEEHIAKIKELGGPEQINWEPIFEKMTLPARRFIEATMVEGERLRQQKDSAIAEARANSEEYAKGRSARDLQQVTDFANSHVKGLVWANEREIPAGATPEERTAIEESNKYARGAQAKLQQYLSDRSPERIAELAVGTLIAHKLNADVVALRAVQKEHDTQVAAITKERDELRTQLEAIKKATTRGKGDQIVPPKKQTPVAEVDGAENLDNLAQEEVARASD